MKSDCKTMYCDPYSETRKSFLSPKIIFLSINLILSSDHIKIAKELHLLQRTQFVLNQLYYASCKPLPRNKHMIDVRQQLMLSEQSLCEVCPVGRPECTAPNFELEKKFITELQIFVLHVFF
jgi:hypothetical protein